MSNIRLRFLLLLFALVLLLSACNVTISPSGSTGSGNPQAHGNTAPDSGTFDGCPARGDGGDSQLNMLKNRTDTAPWTPVSFSDMISWTWPQSVEKQEMASWSQADANAVAQHLNASRSPPVRKICLNSLLHSLRKMSHMILSTLPTLG